MEDTETRAPGVASLDLNLMPDRYGLEFGGFRYFVAPQEQV